MKEQTARLGDLEITIIGQVENRLLSLLYYFLCVLSGGIFYLISHWCKFYPFYKPSDFKDASFVKVRTSDETIYLQLNRISKESSVDLRGYISLDPEQVITYFTFKCFRLVYCMQSDSFIIAGETNVFESETSWINGLSFAEAEKRMGYFGLNGLMIPEKSTIRILVDEVIHPFMLFQLLSIALWFTDEYYYYASCILIITLFSVLDTLIETKKNYRHLRELCKIECLVKVYRDGELVQVNSQNIAPGDLIDITESKFSSFPCDIAIVSGDALVNESMLTGESTVVSKIAISKNVSMQKVLDDKRNFDKNILYHGTKLEKVRDGTKGIVINTGFNTSKGCMIRSILFPKATNFKFYSEALKFVAFLFALALCGFSLAIYNFVRLNTSTFRIIKRSFDVFTIVVPPALPATLSVGMSYALRRLKNSGITCISPTRINVGGNVDCVCFDKTGTLTEEGLDLVAIIPISKETTLFCPMISIDKNFEKSSLGDKESDLVFSMSFCHSLREHDEKYVGDPIDMKLFEFAGGHLSEEWDKNESKVVINITNSFFGKEFTGTIICTNDFVPKLRRMSVIVRNESADLKCYVKGAPEVIIDLCLKNSVPVNVKEQLARLTEKGYRVIAAAHKTLSQFDSSNDRIHVEKDLTFLGLFVLENRVKAKTPHVLKTLNDSGIFCVMSTGDNILTSLSVGRECQLLDCGNIFVSEMSDDEANVLVWKSLTYEGVSSSTFEISEKDHSGDLCLAMTGDCFEHFISDEKNENFVRKILSLTRIYARMSPEQKAKLVDQLKAIGYCVAMVGDGNNDVSALASSDVGISLSNADASVAAAFTANQSIDIESILHVIREGRTALVTSYSCFKYMAVYSLTQFSSISILYFMGSSLADFQFLYIDLLVVLPLALTMGRSKPLGKIVRERPTSSLISHKLMIPILGHLTIQVIFQAVMYLSVQKIQGYERGVISADQKNTPSFENSAVFLFSIFLYVTYACIFSIGAPYREPAWKNSSFVIVCVAVVILNLLILFLPFNLINDLTLVDLPTNFKMMIFVCAIAAAILSWILERFVFPFFSSALDKRQEYRKVVKVANQTP